MPQSENPKKPYFEPELKAQGKISGLTQMPASGISGGFPTTTFRTLAPTPLPE